MAYTIISQNNTTTTLSDENGNVITVPARVTLATSTDYTIKKVNNNSVDLESGDGKIIRGVPACVVLAGEGGGGGSVDYAKTVQRAETMPTADASNAGQQFLYSGESDATYTHGYIYENVATTTSSSASAEQTVGSTLSDIAVDLATLESFTGWTTDNSLQIFYTADGWSVDATSLGVTYTGTPNVGDAITITYTAESTTYAWTRVDVQPGGATYTAGNGISIDANNEISATAPVAYETETTGSPEVQKGSAATRVGLLAIGNLAVAGGRQSTAGGQCLAIGDRANAGNYYGHNAIAIGMGTENYKTMASQYSVAIGCGTWSLDQGIALGHGLKSGRGGIIIGYNTPSSTQIEGGAQCFDVVLFNTSTFVANQYRILDANGKIPVERINDSAVVKYSSMPTGSPDISGMIVQYVGETDATYTNGYFYKCSGIITAPSSVEVDTVSTNVDPTLVSVDISTLESWMVAHSKPIDYNSTIYLYCFGTKWLITINGVQSGQVYLSDCGVTYSGTAQSGDIIYLNYTAATKEYSWVQTNVQPSGLPSTTGLADGNYRLRLVMASGVPTLEWVAE